MREEIPTTGAVAVVVEPRAEDEVGSDAEEEAMGDNVSKKSILFLRHPRNPKQNED